MCVLGKCKCVTLGGTHRQLVEATRIGSTKHEDVEDADDDDDARRMAHCKKCQSPKSMQGYFIKASLLQTSLICSSTRVKVGGERGKAFLYRL